MNITKAHGCSNDVLLIPHHPQVFETHSWAIADVVRLLCRRDGQIGADGVYFIDLDADVPSTYYFNADGSYAEYCGNGLRCAGRYILDAHHVDRTVVMSGDDQFEIERLPADGGVEQIAVTSERPVRFMRFGASDAPLREGAIPEYSTSLHFTAFNGPNPHLVTVVDTYDESLLEVVGLTANADRSRFPHGVNTSFVVDAKESGTEYFVRTYERGVGLTPSCASGAVASVAMLVAQRNAPLDRSIRVRNSGGVINVQFSGTEDNLYPRQWGNATFVYECTVDIESMMQDPLKGMGEVAARYDEIRAYDLFWQDHQRELREVGLAGT